MSNIVTLPWDPKIVLQAAQWASEHCPSYETYEFVHQVFKTNTSTIYRCTDNVEYFFKEERDAVLFALRWA
jgi:hypothetical protein